MTDIRDGEDVELAEARLACHRLRAKNKALRVDLATQRVRAGLWKRAAKHNRKLLGMMGEQMAEATTTLRRVEAVWAARDTAAQLRDGTARRQREEMRRLEASVRALTEQRDRALCERDDLVREAQRRAPDMADFERGSCLANGHNATLGAHPEAPDCLHWWPKVTKAQLAALLSERAADAALTPPPGGETKE